MALSTAPRDSADKSGIKGGARALMLSMAAFAMTACDKPHFAQHNSGNASVGALVEKVEDSRALLQGAARSTELPRVGNDPLNVQSFDNLHEYLSKNLGESMVLRDDRGNGEYIDFAFTIEDGEIIITYTSPSLTVGGKKTPVDGKVTFKKTEAKGKKTATVTFHDGATTKEVDHTAFRSAVKTHLGVL